ncbi:MAG TPA: DMT family transporter [Deltaproteobacteria bacterium]|nr:DMT family transporter [Deltaproteobacteria bacterium]HQB37898.1 DMT family transporter [Deltaproteobacteria bacterium]
MSNLAFALIVASSITHALWNLLVKRSDDKTVFIWWMFVVAGGLFTLVLPLLPERFAWPDLHALLMALIGATCFTLYHVLNGRAYRGGDMSVVYPLSQTSMIYVPIWGILLLGERLSLIGACGILLVVLGTYSVQLQRLSLADMFKPFKNLRSQSVQSSLAAGFIYSIGSIAEKSGVRDYSPLLFTYLMVMCMLTMMTLNVCRKCYHQSIITEVKSHWRLILCSGPVIMASFLSFRYGLNLAPVSYAVPVRQVSVLVGVLIGIVFLKESFGRIRLVSATVIMAGALLIKLG